MNLSKLLLELKDLKPYIYHTATTGSIYIKFEDSSYGSLRIGTHPGREKYTYKWNLRSDIEEFYEEVDRGVIRRYYPYKDINRMVKDLLELHSICQSPIENYFPYNGK